MPILTALNLANQCDLVYKNSKNQRLQVELSLIKMCHIHSVIQLASSPSTLPKATDQDQDKKKTLVSSGQAQSIKPKDQSETVTESLKVAIPAPIEKKEKPTVAKPAQTEAQKVSIPPPAAPIKIQPLVKASGGSLIPSLTDFSSGNNLGGEDEGPQYVSGNDTQAFTKEQFMAVWKQCIQRANAEDKIHLFTLLSSNEPIIDGTDIIVSIENIALESTLQDEKIELLNFIRSQLKNFDIQIVTKRREPKLSTRIYSNKDKYAYLVDKNPQLEKFRQRFNLDLLP
mgnify:CR=1 FL=1